MNERILRKYLRKQFAPISWWLLAYYLIMNVAVLSVIAIHDVLFEPTTEELMGNAWGYLLAAAVGLLWLRLWKKKQFWREGVWAKGRAMGLGAFLKLMVLTIGCQMAASIYGMVLEALLNLFGLSAMVAVESATAGADTLSMFLYMGVGAPIVEELIFRGFVQQTLKPYGKKFAILGSAILFGLFHGNLFQSPYAFLVGLVLGYTAMEYSIAWAMLLHMVNNLVLGDMLSRLTMGLPEEMAVTILLLITSGCGFASIFVLLKERRKIRAYQRRERLDKRCLLCFMLNAGFIALTLVMIGNMASMLLVV